MLSASCAVRIRRAMTTSPRLSERNNPRQPGHVPRAPLSEMSMRLSQRMFTATTCVSTRVCAQRGSRWRAQLGSRWRALGDRQECTVRKAARFGRRAGCTARAGCLARGLLG